MFFHLFIFGAQLETEVNVALGKGGSCTAAGAAPPHHCLNFGTPLEQQHFDNVFFQLLLVTPVLFFLFFYYPRFKKKKS